MKDKDYLAINLKDFHANQNGKPETNAQIKFISAKNYEDAKRHLQNLYPNTAWFLLLKENCDKNIVYAKH